MASTPSTPEKTGPRKRLQKRLKEGIYLAAAIAGILTIPVAYHIYCLSRNDTPTPEPLTRTVIHSGTTQKPTPAPEESSSPTSSCYDGDAPTLCSSQHTREIYSSSSGSCDETSIILHLGGNPGIDILDSSLSIEEIPDFNGMCSVTHAGGLPMSPLKDLWTKDDNNDGYSDGGELRQCFNHQGLPTSCDDPHYSEIIYQGDQEIDCREHYRIFSGRSANVDKNIKIIGYPEGDQFSCRVEVQTSNESLLHSVRNLNDTRPLIH